MRRRYTTENFAERIEAVRRLMPDAFIGIDVIVGFPGETESDFRTTYEFLERLAPAYLHIFPFSERPGTPAVDFPDKECSLRWLHGAWRSWKSFAADCTANSAPGPKVRRTRCCSRARCGAG